MFFNSSFWVKSITSSFISSCISYWIKEWSLMSSRFKCIRCYFNKQVYGATALIAISQRWDFSHLAFLKFRERLIFMTSPEGFFVEKIPKWSRLPRKKRREKNDEIKRRNKTTTTDCLSLYTVWSKIIHLEQN